MQLLETLERSEEVAQVKACDRLFYVSCLGSFGIASGITYRPSDRDLRAVSCADSIHGYNKASVAEIRLAGEGSIVILMNSIEL